jgi:ABC-type phosphate transport system substrate-binding protein
MWNRRRFVYALNSTVFLGALILCGCNSRGEDAVREKDFAASPTIKTATGAAGSTFIAPIINNGSRHTNRCIPIRSSTIGQSGAAPGSRR